MCHLRFSSQFKISILQLDFARRPTQIDKTILIVDLKIRKISSIFEVFIKLLKSSVDSVARCGEKRRIESKYSGLDI